MADMTDILIEVLKLRTQLEGLGREFRDLFDYNPDQPRDEQGRFGEGGSGSSGGERYKEVEDGDGNITIKTSSTVWTRGSGGRLDSEQWRNNKLTGQVKINQLSDYLPGPPGVSIPSPTAGQWKVGIKTGGDPTFTEEKLFSDRDSAIEYGDTLVGHSLQKP